MATPTATWLESITDETTARAIAAKLGRSHTTVNRWLRQGIPIESVVHICVDQRIDLPASLVALGFITPAQSLRLPRNIAVVPTWDLTAELHRRAVKARRTTA